VVSGPQSFGTECRLLVRGNLVVGYADGASTTIVLAVQSHNGMCGRARSREEVDNERIRFAADKQAERIFDRVKGFRIRKTTPWNEFAQKPASVPARIMRLHVPNRLR
jgi:hypothetical protein